MDQSVCDSIGFGQVRSLLSEVRMKPDMDCIIPIDSFVRMLPKRPSVCVGVGYLASQRSSLDALSAMDLARQLALGWIAQSQAPGCLVSSTDRLSAGNESAGKQAAAKQAAGKQAAAKPAVRGLQEVYWGWLGESGSDPSEISGQVLRDVAGLTNIRVQNGLVLIELGSIDSPQALQASRLCDGLVLVTKASERCVGKSKARLESFERSDCRWLGYWTVDRVAGLQ